MKISAPAQKYFFFVVLAGVFLWLFCVLFRPFERQAPEAQHQGKKLTDWAKEIDQGDFFRKSGKRAATTEQNKQAIAAIRQIGTNALPVALALLAAKDSWLKRKWEALACEYNYDGWPNQPRFPMNIKSAGEKHFGGVNIIWALGPAAKPGIPALIQLLQSPNPGIADDVMFALPGAGTNVVPPLMELLHSPHQDARVRAAILLGRFFGSQAHAAVPVLLQCLEDKNLNLARRVEAIHALGFIKGEASLIVPAIVRHGQNETNWMILGSDFAALGNLGTKATSAVPFLVHILANPELPPDRPPKPSAMHALEKIDPKAAKPFFDQWETSLTNADASTNALDLIHTPNPPPKRLQSSPSVQTNSAPS